jgi:GTP-binding protein
LPGLIDGAHAGVGLGHEFLRHVERTRVLVHLVEPFPTDGSDPVHNCRTIRRELELHSPVLAQKPELLALSKSEWTGSEHVRERMAAELGREVLAISAVTGQGLAQLVARVAQLLDEAREREASERSAAAAANQSFELPATETGFAPQVPSAPDGGG